MPSLPLKPLGKTLERTFQTQTRIDQFSEIPIVHIHKEAHLLLRIRLAQQIVESKALSQVLPRELNEWFSKTEKRHLRLVVKKGIG
jgi:hypothetical protein